MKVLGSILIAIAVVFTIASCNSSSKTTDPNNHKVVVKEILQAGEYTYLKVEENDSLNWIALPSVEAEIGKTYYYQGGMAMINFKSKELDRTFDKVYFIEKISAEPITAGKDSTAGSTVSTTAPHKGKKKIVGKKAIKIVPPQGAVTIAELYTNQSTYSGKTVKVKGVVVKYNPQIMNKNWIHLQDGTEYKGDYDLTVTAKFEATLGDTITVEGKIALNKDYGYDYFYKLIMEDAVKK